MIVEAVKNGVNFIGRLGENEARVIRFPVRETLYHFPGCTFTLLNKRPGDANAYPSPNIQVTGNFLYWTVTSGDLTKVGFGEVEVTASLNGAVVKNDIYDTEVKTALDGSGTVPEPWTSWVTQVTNAAQQAEDAVEHYPKIEDGYWYIWVADAWVNTGEKAQGDKGDPGDPGDQGDPGEDGFSPTVDVEEISGGHRVTITDADGDHAFNVMDGESGGGGTSDYNDLSNKPQIGGTTLSGNKSLSDLGIASASDVSAKYTKPGTGIPSSDMASAVQTSLGKADSAYQKPSGGIPASDIASGVIPDPTSIIDDTAGDGATNKVWSADKVNELKSTINGKYTKPVDGIPASDLASGVQTSLGKADSAYQKPSTGIPASDLASGVLPSVPVTDVQVGGTSVLSQGVANVPVASTSALGTVKTSTAYGTAMLSEGIIKLEQASTSQIKAGTQGYKPIVPERQHESVFYGLAKASGDTTQASSSNAVGTYTDDAKIKIQKMLGVCREWELIVEVTTTEDLETLEVITDSNGDAFELSEMYVRAALTAPTTGTNDYFKGSTYTKKTNDTYSWGSLSTLNFKSTTGITYVEYKHELICGNVFMLSKSATGFSNTQNAQLASFNDYGLDDIKSITGIRLQQYNSTSSLIPTGSKIRIYGIRK